MGERIIQLLNSAVNLAALFCFAVCLLYGAYGIWDAARISRDADTSRYLRYQPDETDGGDFEGLQKKNPEVIAWLSIPGTDINYPIAQGEDNRKYVNTNVEGEYAQSGSLFLDYRNKKDFTTLNNIIYGHHMEEGKMFGDLDRFLDQTFFEKHKTGRLYYEGKYHILEIIAIVRDNAYDKVIYDPDIETEEQFQELVRRLQDAAVYGENFNAKYGERLVLLSTCDAQQTDGRIILVTKLKEKP